MLTAPSPIGHLSRENDSSNRCRLILLQLLSCQAQTTGQWPLSGLR